MFLQVCLFNFQVLKFDPKKSDNNSSLIFLSSFYVYISPSAINIDNYNLSIIEFLIN
jgi:hypothetical protein